MTTRAPWASRFATQIALRVAGLLGLGALLAYLATATDLRVVTALVAGLLAVQATLVVRYVARTNRELSRLLGALRYDDFQQSFSLDHLGTSFAELGSSFEGVLARFRDARLEREAQARYLEALIEHVPVAILAIDEGGTVELLNGAARRLLNEAATTSVAALERYGAAFQRDVAQSKTGDRTVTRTELGGVQRHLILSTTQLTVAGAPVRLITLQDIQGELDSSEMAAWRDMARVLSHEIMNSLTPIASLARTADELVDDLRAHPPGSEELVADLHAAVHTLARRSDGLMRFVQSYRQLTQLPPPALRPVPLPDYFARLDKLLVAQWAGRGITLHVSAPAAGLTVVADESLLDQAVINVLRNAADATAGGPEPQVWLAAGLSERGRPIIEIADNGPGLDVELGEKIFLPFFTTKPEGSGIGLALARQVMLIHGGAITATTRPGGGALFRFTF